MARREVQRQTGCTVTGAVAEHEPLVVRGRLGTTGCSPPARAVPASDQLQRAGVRAAEHKTRIAAATATDKGAELHHHSTHGR